MGNILSQHICGNLGTIENYKDVFVFVRCLAVCVCVVFGKISNFISVYLALKYYF